MHISKKMRHSSVEKRVGRLNFNMKVCISKVVGRNIFEVRLRKREVPLGNLYGVKSVRY